ncbi:gliding motility-associated C-terminal domain-containing protein [Danxiaibacter flavus]|uniref:Gliding motility-associated C-terminal domain-containing protein n=1 Tax=Danxiaibacter flavus TaxID=3049108 RepID=A0ABV3ZE89_9BACT|nr:gliding motility-associated C-terminal domain-containing protein [Chitinophagaceae bacterium DXS]
MNTKTYGTLIILSFLVNLCNYNKAHAQASFEAPDTVCVNTPVTVKNTSPGGKSFYWNFDLADINRQPEAVNLGNPGGTLSWPVFMDMVEDNGNFYGFVIDFDIGKLIRLDFGNSMLNNPVAVDLGHLGGVLPSVSGTEGVQIIKNEGKWYGLIVGGSPAAGTIPSITRVSFGTDITNPNPVAFNWGNIGGLQQPIDLYVFSDNGHWYGFTTSAENNTITRFDFTTSFENTPTAENLGNIGDLNYPTGIYAINDKGSWSVFVTNGGTYINGTNASLSRLDFGNSLLNQPTGVNLGNPGDLLHEPRDFNLLNFCGQFVGFAVNGYTRDIVKFDFGDDIKSQPSAISLGNIGDLARPHSISKLFRVGNEVYAFITNVANNTITRLRFASYNGADVSTSTLRHPSAVSYSKPGIYNINLLIDEGLPSQSSFCKSIVVLDNLGIKNIDTAFCKNDSLVLKRDPIYTNYEWSTSTTDTSITVKKAGNYWLKYEYYGCTGQKSYNVKENSLPAISLANDTSFCKNETLLLDAGAGRTKYLWQDGSGGQQFLVSSAGKYKVVVQDENLCTNTDSTTVTYLTSPTILMMTDTTVCGNQTIQLHASGDGIYEWTPATGLDDNSTINPQAYIDKTITYTLTVTATNGCASRDSVTVTNKPKPTFTVSPNVSNICNGDSVLITVKGGDVYYWTSQNDVVDNPAAENNIVSPGNNTVYEITATDTACKVTESLYATINLKESPHISILKSNDLDCSTGEATLTAQGALYYSWNPSENITKVSGNKIIVRPLENTTYYVKGKASNNCESLDSVVVKVVTNTALNGNFMPTAFTPNGDGLNDYYGLTKWGAVRNLEFSIYNRWGQRVFYTTNPGAKWNGIYKGLPQPSGTYIYDIKAKTLCGDAIRKGSFVLIK